MKKLIRLVNDSIIQIFLFFTYFLGVGIAYLMYKASAKKNNKYGNWNNKTNKLNREYFTSPY